LGPIMFNASRIYRLFISK